MHFFYLDESGCTGTNLADQQQPIFVLGGISVKDKGWNRTQSEFAAIISDYFNGNVPEEFELHGTELLSPNGEGPFEDHPIEERLDLVRAALDLLSDRGHGVHLYAISKSAMAASTCALNDLPYNSKTPFLCAFDYLITYINDHVKNRLGQSARGMVIMDQKDQFYEDVERITRHRRFSGPAAHRVKWVVEFSYPVDSRKNPMVQLSDLVVLCTRRFLEVEHEYHDNYPEEAKLFYAECYSIIQDRIPKKQVVQRCGRGMDCVNDYLEEVQCKPRRLWRRQYGLN